MRHIRVFIVLRINSQWSLQHQLKQFAYTTIKTMYTFYQHYEYYHLYTLLTMFK